MVEHVAMIAGEYWKTIPEFINVIPGYRQQYLNLSYWVEWTPKAISTLLTQSGTPLTPEQAEFFPLDPSTKWAAIWIESIKQIIGNWVDYTMNLRPTQYTVQWFQNGLCVIPIYQEDLIFVPNELHPAFDLDFNSVLGWRPLGGNPPLVKWLIDVMSGQAPIPVAYPELVRDFRWFLEDPILSRPEGVYINLESRFDLLYTSMKTLVNLATSKGFMALEVSEFSPARLSAIVELARMFDVSLYNNCLVGRTQFKDRPYLVMHSLEPQITLDWILSQSVDLTHRLPEFTLTMPERWATDLEKLFVFLMAYSTAVTLNPILSKYLDKIQIRGRQVRFSISSRTEVAAIQHLVYDYTGPVEVIAIEDLRMGLLYRAWLQQRDQKSLIFEHQRTMYLGYQRGLEPLPDLYPKEVIQQKCPVEVEVPFATAELMEVIPSTQVSWSDHRLAIMGITDLEGVEGISESVGLVVTQPDLGIQTLSTRVGTLQAMTLSVAPICPKLDSDGRMIPELQVIPVGTGGKLVPTDWGSAYYNRTGLGSVVSLVEE